MTRTSVMWRLRFFEFVAPERPDGLSFFLVLIFMLIKIFKNDTPIRDMITLRRQCLRILSKKNGVSGAFHGIVNIP